MTSAVIGRGPGREGPGGGTVEVKGEEERTDLLLQAKLKMSKRKVFINNNPTKVALLDS